ncbi:hypothetical protein D3C73_1283790 [compost metagenome]
MRCVNMAKLLRILINFYVCLVRAKQMCMAMQIMPWLTQLFVMETIIQQQITLNVSWPQVVQKA